MWTEKIIQALCYLLKGLNESCNDRLINFLYFADKYHLLRYSRTVTKDSRYVTVNGVVSVAVKAILEFDENLLDSYQLNIAQKLIAKNGFVYSCKDKNFDDFDLLGETDIEALDFVIKNMSGWSREKTIEYSRKYPEWQEYELLFNENINAKSEIISLEKLFSTIEGDILSGDLDEEDIEISKKITLDFGCE